MFPIFAGNSAVTGYNLTRSLRFRSAATAYLARTPATTTNQQTWTWSGWVKRGVLSSGTSQTLFNASVDASNFTELRFTDTSNGVFEFTYVVGGADTARLTTTQVFRDPSAYYHVVFVADTTQATAANRLKLYINGAQVTAFSTATYPALNANLYVNSANTHGIGVTRAVGRYYDGYLTEINLIDGQALTPSSFGSTNATTGVWQPAKYSGTYGTNGFYLPFTDNSALTTSSNVGLGKDFSGNANYWTTNNISLTSGVTYDSMLDVPTLTSATAANFAVLNPLDKEGAPTFSNGNLYAAGVFKTRSTMALPTGVKTYVEIYQTGTASTVDVFCGLILSAAVFSGAHANPGVNWYASDTIYGQLNGSTAFSFAGTLAGGAILQLAYDGSTGKVWLGINNTWYTSAGATSGNPSAGTGEFATLSTSASWSVYCGSSTGSQTITAKFGQNGQSYTPPTGFVALNTYNLPTSTILAGNKVMDATLYSGNLIGQTITNAAGFKPDLVWVKSRSAATDNKLTDSVRGATLALVSNSTAAETTDVTGVVSFNSNGFTLGTSTTYNNTGATYVGWQWQAGQGSTSSNTNGSITSTVSVNASAGFSVVTYMGTGANATIGHGLGVAPAMVITKSRSAVSDWGVYHSSLTSASYYLRLNNNLGQTLDTTYWNGTAPTSSVFSVGGAVAVNSSAATYVAYCWTPIAGYSAFGLWTNNNSTDGTFTYTGFRPKLIMLKETAAGERWFMYDSARQTYNVTPPSSTNLVPSDSSAEGTNAATTATIDLLSNGFKIRTTNPASGEISFGTRSYIYAAWAENPFKNSLAR